MKTPSYPIFSKLHNSLCTCMCSTFLSGIKNLQGVSLSPLERAILLAVQSIIGYPSRCEKMLPRREVLAFVRKQQRSEPFLPQNHHLLQIVDRLELIYRNRLTNANPVEINAIRQGGTSPGSPYVIGRGEKISPNRPLNELLEVIEVLVFIGLDDQVSFPRLPGLTPSSSQGWMLEELWSWKWWRGVVSVPTMRHPT